MEPGPTSESSSTSSDGSNDFQSNYSMSEDTVSEPALPALPWTGDVSVVPFNQPYGTFGGSAAYHLPTPNLQRDFRLESSSMLPPFPPMQLFNSQYSWTNRQPQNQMVLYDPLSSFGSQDLSIQSMVGPGMAPNSLYPNGFMPYHYQNLNSPFQQDQTMNWNQGTSQSFSSYATPKPRTMRNSVYDPIFELMGLPVDPHLRCLMAKRNSEKED